ncbi:hypothetical protein EYF80_030439 [Liparis tanakae]|uniref:Uncharacterized protein n=1 Tax=Liparis tanakae TaxID=230148 RepID=A0A4Z2H0R2_9TELE|nr:hypothetical protein EYF80_030439 [Liparis tanakae]
MTSLHQTRSRHRGSARVALIIRHAARAPQTTSFADSETANYTNGDGQEKHEYLADSANNTVKKRKKANVEHGAGEHRAGPVKRGGVREVHGAGWAVLQFSRTPGRYGCCKDYRDSAYRDSAYRDSAYRGSAYRGSAYRGLDYELQKIGL